MYNLQDHGVEIIPNAIPTQLVDEAKQALDKWLLDYAGVDTSSVRPGVKPKGWPSNRHGIIQNFGVSHLQEIWNLRTHRPLIQHVVKAYNDAGIQCKGIEDMLVSFDGVCIMYPYSNASLTMMKSDLHLDQSADVKQFECIQGFVPLLDMHEDHGTLEVLLGSHKFFNETATNDWSLIQEKVQMLVDRGCKPTRFTVPKGSYVMWDSQTVHRAIPHKVEIPVEQRLWRYVSYICYQPRSMASAASLTKRIKAFEDLRMTNHLASKPKLFPKEPRLYQGEVSTIRYFDIRPTLDELGRRLVGY